MAYNAKQQAFEGSEQMGAFSGYIRRPTPSSSGMTAQIFGENGDDADTILALSLSKYQDAEVLVNIYLVKDALGRIMKTDDKYPLVSSFVGFVRRSTPKKDGMVAQFFAPNGPHSDSVSELSKSEYQDCLVFVDVRGKKAIDNLDKVENENFTEIDKNYSMKITRTEKEEFQRKEKAYRKMNEILEISDFLSRIDVISSIGNVEEYKEWLTKTQTCAHIQEKPCLNHSSYLQVNGLIKPFNYLPICEEHKDELLNNVHVEKNMLFYEMKHRLLLKKWVWDRFKEQFSYDGKSEPEPNKIIEWAASKKLQKYLPNKYVPII